MAKTSKRVRDEQRRATVARYAELSRVRFRELAHAGQLPGITTSTW